MDDFLALIARLDSEDSAELINNSSTEHAVQLIARLCARARKTVSIFSGSLSPVIYSKKEILDALRVFLVGRNGQLEIVIQNGTKEAVNDEGSLIWHIRNDLGAEALGRVSVRLAPDEIKKAATFHFMVVDEKGFRFEPDITSHKAVGCFNNPDVAKKLKEMFSEVFKVSEQAALA